MQKLRYYLIFKISKPLSELVAIKEDFNLVNSVDSAFDFAYFCDTHDVSYSVELIPIYKFSDEMCDYYLDSDYHAVFYFDKNCVWMCF